MTERTPHTLLRDEAGLTLPEVIVYIVISVLVLVGLVGMFASGLSAHANTRARDTATGAVGVAVNSLQASIRNSSGFNISGSALRARVAVGNETAWECRAWSLAGGTLFYKASPTAITIPASSASYTKANGWTDLTNGVKGVSGTLGPSGSKFPFQQQGNRLLYGFQVLAGDAGTGVTLEGSAVPQAFGGESPTCW